MTGAEWNGEKERKKAEEPWLPKIAGACVAFSAFFSSRNGGADQEMETHKGGLKLMGGRCPEAGAGDQVRFRK